MTETTAERIARESFHCTFNTGRYYAPEGQVIAAIYCAKSRRILFADVSRCINVVIDTNGEDLSDPVHLQRYLMNCYDNGDYRYARDGVERDLLRLAEEHGLKARRHIIERDPSRINSN